jgi:uncharacterized membrane protein
MNPEKPKNQPPSNSRFVNSGTRTFDVNLPLDECYERLKNWKHPNKLENFFSGHTQLNIESFTADSSAFSLWRNHQRTSPKITGIFEVEEGQALSVKLEANISFSPHVFIIPVLIFGFIFYRMTLGFSLLSSIFVAMMIIFGVSLGLYMNYKTQNDLFKHVENLLLHQEKKKNS